MPKKKSKVTLSRFFLNSCTTIQNENRPVRNKSKKCSPSKRKISNEKSKSADFKGFTTNEQTLAERLTTQFDTANFTGLNYSGNDTKHDFQGFSQKDQAYSVGHVSKIIDACHHMKISIQSPRKKISKTRKEKAVCSKYWSKMSQQLIIKMEKCDRLNIKTEKNEKKRNKIQLVKLENEENESVYDARIEMKPKMKHISDIKTKKEFVIPSFIPPSSPHQLIEEQLYHDPWALLVATIFLNKTSCRVARPYIFWFLGNNPTPTIVLEKPVGDLEKYFEALGLQRTRAMQVWRMSYDFIYKNWKNVGELYGVGRYAQDAFRMFCMGDFSVDPKDRYLRIYKAWYEMQEKQARLKEMNS